MHHCNLFAAFILRPLLKSAPEVKADSAIPMVRMNPPKHLQGSLAPRKRVFDKGAPKRRHHFPVVQNGVDFSDALAKNRNPVSLKCPWIKRLPTGLFKKGFSAIKSKGYLLSR